MWSLTDRTPDGKAPKDQYPPAGQPADPQVEIQDENKRFKERQKHNFDRRHRVQQSLPTLLPDHEVWVKTGVNPKPAKVVTSANTPRSYVVQTPSGQQLRRNANI